MTARSSLLVLLSLLTLGACTPKLQEEYTVDIVGDLSTDFLVGATKAVLELNDQVVATTMVAANGGFSLRGGGINVSTMPSGVFRVKVMNDAGVVLGIGQSPELELELASPPEIRIFIQKPGSFGRTIDLDIPRRNMIAVPVLGVVEGNARAKPVTAALLGLGNVTVPGEGGTMVEKPSEVLMLFNPITQITIGAGSSGMPSGSPHPRAYAGAATHVDGSALIFGGEVMVNSVPPGLPSSQLDAVKVTRSTFNTFARNLSYRESTVAGVARLGPAVVFTDAPYAIGGRAAGQPLDTVVGINPNDSGDGFRLLPQKLAGPRDGHTATVLTLASGREALIFGGATAGVPVAEVLVAGGALMIPTGNGGPPRRDHAAVVLPGEKVLVLGGRNDGGVLGDSVLYQGNGRTLGPGGLTLQRPRAEFAAFVVGDDLVVAGGIDAAGNLIDRAEIYDANTLQPKAMDVPCLARSGAAVVVLPHRFVLLIGGTAMVPNMPGVRGATGAVETYQPFVK